MRKYIFYIGIVGIACLSFFTEWASYLSVVMAILVLLMLLDKLGKGIVLREIVAFLYVLTCLVMPTIGYAVYTRTNPLARLWVKYMPVPYEVYFSYALPAISLFCVALLMPFRGAKYNEQGGGLIRLITDIKKALVGSKNIGLIILGIGFVISFVIKYLPGDLQFFGTLFFFASFAGLLYVNYSPHFRHKKLVLILYCLFTIYNAISIGMFTIVAYMGITISSFLLLAKRLTLFKKVMIFIVAAAFLIVLQNVKLAYRAYIWRSNYGGNKVTLFADLFWTTMQKGDDLIEKNAFFQIYVRANQGFNVALVMRRIPKVQPYDNGNNLMKNFASAFVPRFLWPNKPNAGGAFNMQYYAGYYIYGWSTNVGPLGEAYGSFGVVGGIIYMFCLGLLVRFVYVQVFKISGRLPLLVCWIPVIFYQVISSAETDSLQIFNSLAKSAFFVWLLYKVFPQWFGVRSSDKRTDIRSGENSRLPLEL